MNSEEVLTKLRECETELRARGVRHAALFGSVARGTATPTSDIDIMIDVDPDADMSVYEYVGLKRYIAELFDGPVDVIDREGLRPYIRPPAESEAVYAF
jgi:predicted nucleotidyltransferase